MSATARFRVQAVSRPGVLGFWASVILTWTLAVSLLCGCSQPAADQGADVDSKAGLSEPNEPKADPQELLGKLKQAYRETKAYTDNSVVIYSGVSRATGSLKEIEFTRSSIAFRRPNELHLTHKRNMSGPGEESFEIACNGAVVRSRTDYPADQIHEAIAPEGLTVENFAPEPVFREELLSLLLENTFPQLSLLLNEEAEAPVFDGEAKARTLQDVELAGKTYHRVELPTPAGKRVMWIDPESFLLRRMKLPIDRQRKQLTEALQANNISVMIDFEDVTLDPELDEELFTMDVPEGARRVRRFIQPPGDGPPEYLGKPVGEFAFKTLAGEDVTRDSVSGKVTILDFWSTICPPCRQQTPVLNEVYQHFASNEKVEFIAVSTDSRVVANETVEKTLRNWGGEMPIVRDPTSSYYHELSVRQTPSMILIDDQGRLQSFMVGAHRTAQPLIDSIQRLIDGEDFAALARKRHAEYLVKHEEALEAAEIEDSILEVEVVSPKVGEQKLPERLRLKQLWLSNSKSLTRPGEVKLVTHQAWGPSVRMFALDGSKAVVELNHHTGEVVGRHALPEQDQQSGGFVRTWINDEGKLWTLASGVGWQQVHVFNDQWESVLSFPDESHSGIGDVLFDDLASTGTPVLYVGYWGGLGIQGGTLDGRRLWTNRLLNHVLQVSPGPTVEDQEQGKQQTTWCTSTRGTLMQLSAAGKALREQYVEGQALMYFASNPTGTKHCGLSVGRAGQYTAVGFDTQGQLQWEYALPAGEYVEPLSRLHHVLLPDGSPAWLVVAANGSLFWIDEAGELIDRFDYGSILTGVSMNTLGDQTVLHVSTSEQLTAWQVDSPPEAPTEEPESENPETADSVSEEPEPSKDDSESAPAAQENLSSPETAESTQSDSEEEVSE